MAIDSATTATPVRRRPARAHSRRARPARHAVPGRDRADAELVAARRTAIIVVLVVALDRQWRARGRRRSARASVLRHRDGRRPTTSTRSSTASRLVEPVSQASVAFPATGTVAAVDVKLGDSVTVGQPLASLDPAGADPDAAREAGDARPGAAHVAEGARRRVGRPASATGSTGTGAATGRAARRARRTSPPPRRRRRRVRPSCSPRDHAALEQPRHRRGPAGGPRRAAARSTPRWTPRRQALDSATTVCAAAGVGSAPPSTPTTAQLTACQTAMQQVLTRAGRGERGAAAAGRRVDRARHAARPAGHAPSTHHAVGAAARRAVSARTGSRASDVHRVGLRPVASGRHHVVSPSAADLVGVPEGGRRGGRRTSRWPSRRSRRRRS